MKQLWVFIIVMLLFPLIWGAPASAKNGKRELSMEWEEIPGSAAYELEFMRILSGGAEKKPVRFTAQGTRWTGKIHPGQYRVRIRSIDDRGSPGEWDKAFIYWVHLPRPDLLRPSSGEKMQSPSVGEQNVRFEWSAVEGAALYQIEVSQDGKTVVKKSISENNFELDLAVGRAYQWRVMSLLPDENESSESSDWQPFTLAGGPLAAPKIKHPDSQFVTKLEWRPDPLAESFDVEIARKDGAEWKVLERKMEFKGDKIALNPTYPGGTLRLTVTATSSLRERSDPAALEFPVYQGLRTPRAIREAKRREALESASDDFFIAIYQLSNVSYYGQFQELNGTELRFDAVSGTGRIGWAHFAPAARWGWMAIADMSGLVINRQNYTFASAEALALWRTYFNGIYQLRLFFGGVYNQMPHVKGTTSESVTVENMAATGPTFGAQFWYPATKKLGLQLNSQITQNLIGLKTPGGQKMKTTHGIQLGALGSYKLGPSVVGMLGCSLRSNEMMYAAPSGDGSNTIRMGGLFLSFHLEWGF